MWGGEILSPEEAVHRIDGAISRVLDKFQVDEALREAVQDCEFSVSVADPGQQDCPLVVVSEGFERITGYCCEEIIGLNCRFLNQGCDLNEADLLALRRSSITGEPFTALLQNRRSTGELFMNLLSMHGLVVGRDRANGRGPVMFLIGLQADVTDDVDPTSGEVPQWRREELAGVSARIREALTKQFGQLAASASWQVGSADELPASLALELFDTPHWVGSASLQEAMDAMDPGGPEKPACDTGYGSVDEASRQQHRAASSSLQASAQQQLVCASSSLAVSAAFRAAGFAAAFLALAVVAATAKRRRIPWSVGGWA